MTGFERRFIIAVIASALIASGCAGAATSSGDSSGRTTKGVATSSKDRARPVAKGARGMSVPFRYDADAVGDLGSLAVSSGGTLYLSPSPEDVTAILRSAIHNSVAYADGRAADIVLAVDTTGSMGTAVRAAALAIEIAGDDIRDSGAAVRLGLLEYKDSGDDFVVKTLSDLTNNFERIKGHLAGLEAYGGGDWPEAVPEAVMEALEKMRWDDEAAKTIILIADAPSHGDDARRGLGPRAFERGVAVDVILVGTHTYAGGYDDSKVDAIAPYEGDDDDDDDYDEPVSSSSGTETMEELSDFLGAELHEAKDGAAYRSVVTRILTDLRYGSSSLAPKGGDVDLVLVVDTTGSMGSACAALNEMGGQISAFLKSGGQIAIVNYKDIGDEWVVNTDLDFSRDKDRIMSTLRKLSASGGGDLPEAAWEALAEASKLRWRKRASKVVVLITDADAHTREPHKKDVRRWFKSTGAGLAVIKTGYF